MKKLLLSAIAVFAFTAANAQENLFAKGDVFLSGTVSVGNTSQGDYSKTDFTFSPKAGYFVTENIAVGLGVNVASGKTDPGAGTVTKNNNFGADVFGRYYFTPASQFSIFGQLGVGFSNEKNTTETTFGNTTTSVEKKYNSFNVGLAPGINYAISKHFSLEAAWGALSYASTKQDADGAKAANTFNFNVDLSSINFGLNYKF